MVGRTSLVLAVCAALGAGCSNRDPKVECENSADCSDPKAPHCLADLGCVACLSDDHCSCHHVCDDTNACVALGAESPGFAENAHGNWNGTPGAADYLYVGLCEADNECRIGEICNPLTGSCMAPPEPWENCEFNPCPAGLECEPESLRCLPAALCKSARNCCDVTGFSCSSPGGEQLGLCFARECEPPAAVTSVCPYQPKLTEGTLPDGRPWSCPSGEFCSPLGTCAQCTCNGDCLLPQRPKCDTIAGSCVEDRFCREPDDCDAGQSCDREQQVCEPICQDAAGCHTWETCSSADQVCHCNVDSYDPNDTRTEAAELPLPALGEQTRVEAILCDNETDWFVFHLDRADRIEIQVTTSSSLEADMVLLDENQVRLAAAAVYPGHAGAIDHTADVDGTYYLSLEPVGDEGDFALEISVAQGDVCDEGGPNNSVLSALPLNDASIGPAAGCQVTSGSLGDLHTLDCLGSLRTCADDIDFYLVYSPAGSAVEVTVDHFPETIELVMYGPFDPGEQPNDTRLLDSSTGSAPTKTVNASNRPEVFYVIRITEYWRNASEYDLHVAITAPGGSVCIEDAFDGNSAAGPLDEAGLNDSAEKASGLALTALAADLSLSMCVDDQDWFVLGERVDDELRPLARGQRVVAELQDVSTSATDLLVFLGADDAEVAGRIAALSPKQQTVRLATNNELIYLAVVADSAVDQPVNYSLHTVLETPPPCDLDSLGDLAAESHNDVPADAILLDAPPWPATWDDPPFAFPQAPSDSLSSCIDDDDWYVIETPEYSALNVSIAYPSNDGELGLALFDSSVATLATTPGQPPTQGRLAIAEENGADGQSVRADTGADSTYILVFNRAAWPVFAYDLTVEITPAGCVDDSYEDNDSVSEATLVPLTLSATTPGREEAFMDDLWVCDSDQDWYAVPLHHLDEIEVSATYDAAEGNTDLYIYRPGASGVSLGSDTDPSNSGVLDVSYTVPPTAVEGDYLIKIDPYGSGHESGYELAVTVSRSCLDDRFGPATFDWPAVVSLPEDAVAYGDMQLCDNEDWFEVTAASGSVSVCARFEHLVADIDVEIYDTHADPETTAANWWSRTKEDFEEVVFAADGTTRWVRVYLDFRSSGDISYSLWILPEAGGCPPLCADAVVNGDETDVDCGGTCPACAAGYACDLPSDCVTGNCTGGICQ